MTLEEQKLAVCEKLSELIKTTIQTYGTYNVLFLWKETSKEINWPTEGLQVCQLATDLLIAQGFEFNITYDSGCWIVSFYQMDEPFDIEVKNKDLFTAWIEALCRVWWPERFV